MWASYSLLIINAATPLVQHGVYQTYVSAIIKMASKYFTINRWRFIAVKTLERFQVEQRDASGGSTKV